MVTVLTARHTMAIVMVVGIMATVIIMAVFSVVTRVAVDQIKEKRRINLSLIYFTTKVARSRELATLFVLFIIFSHSPFVGCSTR